MGAISYLLVALCMRGVLSLYRLQTEFEWRTLNYKFPSESFRQTLLQSGRFIPGNSVPLDVDSTEDGRVWITIPRLKPGVPATLATVTDSHSSSSPLLQPYPSWSWHREGNCNGITSVFRIQADQCGRLWVPDTGQVDILSNRYQACPPSLLIFDTLSDHLLVRHIIPSSQLSSTSVIVTIAVDIIDTCGDTIAYMADVAGFGLIAYDLRTRKSWRIQSNYFYPYPRWGYFRIANSEFDLMDGVLGLALSPPYIGQDRVLYFHSLASNSESWVLTSVLREPSNFPNGTNLQPRAFRVFPSTRTGQAAAQAMDDNGILYFGLLSTNSLMCWNSRFPYREPHLVEIDRDDEALQFASGVKIIQRRNYQEVWVLSSRFQKVITDTLNNADTNFRVLRASTSLLVRGTSCEYLEAGKEEPFPASENVLG